MTLTLFLHVYCVCYSPVNNVNSPYSSLGSTSNSQSGTFALEELCAFGERRIEESSDATDRSSSSSDCKISCADKVETGLEGV